MWRAEILLRELSPDSPKGRLNVVHVKYTNIASAPDHLSDVLNKYASNVQSRVVRHERDLEPTDIAHFHNRFRPCNSRRTLIQYHSEPTHLRHGRVTYNPNITHYSSGGEDFPTTRLVISQYHCTLPEYAGCMRVRNVFDFLIPEFVPQEAKEHVIAFSPTATHSHLSRWSDKGEPETLIILQEIQAEYPHVKIDLIKGVPWKDAIQRKRRAAIVIDECKTGSFHLSGLEGLALGKVTLCHLNDDVRDAMLQASGSDVVPFHNVSLSDLKDALRTLVSHTLSTLHEMGMRNRAWMERHWHPRDVAKEFEGIYENIYKSWH